MCLCVRERERVSPQLWEVCVRIGVDEVGRWASCIRAAEQALCG